MPGQRGVACGRRRERNKSNNYKTNRIQCARIASGKKRRRGYKKCEKKESLRLSTRMLRTLWQQQAHIHTDIQPHTHTATHTGTHSPIQFEFAFYELVFCFLFRLRRGLLSATTRQSPLPFPSLSAKVCSQRHRQTASNYKATARVRVPL